MSFEDKLKKLDEEMEHLQGDFKNGRFFEVIIDSNDLAEGLTQAIRGSDSFPSSYLNLMEGKRKVPIADQNQVEELNKRILILRDLIKHAEEKDVCAHSWHLIEKDPTLRGLALHVNCKLCKSDVWLNSSDRYAIKEYNKVRSKITPGWPGGY